MKIRKSIGKLCSFEPFVQRALTGASTCVNGGKLGGMGFRPSGVTPPGKLSKGGSTISSPHIYARLVRMERGF